MSNFDYDAAWKRITTLVSENKVRDAQAEVEKILAAARAEGASVQEVKGLLHSFVFAQPVEEKADSLIEVQLKQAIASSEFPVKNLLHAYLGEFYWKYYQRNRWRFYDRSETEEKPEDFETWSTKTLMKSAGEQFVMALDKPDELFKLKIKDFDILLEEGHESELYRPTLYDLLAHRALDFYENTETSLPEPAVLYSFDVKDAFASARQFAKVDFPDADEITMRDLIAARIYQDLINRHLKSGNTYALVDVDLRRLSFAKERASGPGKDAAYRDAIKALWNKEKKHPASALAAYKLAQWYTEQAASNPPPNEAHAKDYLTAEQICQEAFKLHPESEGGQQCAVLLANINDKDIGLQTEEALPIGEDFRFLLRYRNLNRAFIRIAKLAPAAKKRLERYDWNERPIVAKMLAKLAPIQTWDTGLPSSSDHHPHSVEVMAKGLASGEYIILASDTAGFSMENHALAFVTFTVTDLAFVSWGESDRLEVFVRDRVSGRPIKKAKVKADAFSWRRGNERGKQIFAGKTDNNGEVDITIPTDENRFKLYFSSKREKDRYETGINYFYGYREDRPRSRKHIAFFLDRTIYRPGQTIYVKCLVMDSDGKSHRIVPNLSTSIALYDVNGQEVKSIDVKTNEYGTFSTAFTAPGTLTGNMTLRCLDSRHSFRVEEYKRPTFEVKMEKPKGEVALGETVEVEGKATAYAGNAIDGAEVKYRVVREARFPYWGWRWWLPRPSSPSHEIASGSTTTEPDGSFNIDVELIPDATLDKETQPVFTYTVYTDVVDIAGETHSAQTAVRAAYIGMELSASVPNRIEKGKDVKLKLTAQNLSGGDAELDVKVKLFSLQAPKELLRKRKWSKPDQHLYSQNEWKSQLPHEVFDNEDNPQSWRAMPINNAALPSSGVQEEVKGSKEISLGSFFAPGKYRIECVAKDDKGQEIKTVEEFTVVDSDAKTPAIPTWLDARPNKTSAEPGETVTINLSSSLPRTDFVLRVLQGEKIYRKEFIRLKGKSTVEVDIDESMRGGLDVQIMGLAMNQYLSESIHIKVPWTNKELKLEWMSFRSPLEPGSEEKWKLKVSGPKGEAVAAELVTAMYDASLEAFSPENTYSLSLYPSYRSSIRGISDGWGSSGGNVFSKDWDEKVKSPIPHGYDRLNTFGFEYGARAYQQLAYRNARVMAGGGGFRDVDYKSRSRSVEMARKDGEAQIAEMDRLRAELESPVAQYATVAGNSAGDFGADAFLESDADGVPDLVDKELDSPQADQAPVPLRTNLQETAFFFPQLKTNETGEIELVFTMPEALTRWRLTGLAHTKALDIGTIEGEVVTQKDLMVRPHLPRFLREGDAMTLSSRVVNLTDSDMQGEANLQILDALSMKDVSAKMGIASASRSFTAKAKQTGNVSWEITVPEGISAVVVRVTARANGKADGEENVLPVLSNRMLVTESLPMPIRGAGTKEFNFAKLQNSDQSSTLRHHQLSLEFTPNPVWYAVKSLPYLMEYPHECAEQVFSRYYANALASHVANSKPRIKQVFETWKREAASSGGFMAALEQNQDLKAVVMEETPWVLSAQNDKLRQERIALLFDLNRMADEAARARQQLANMQYNSGGFPWFENMPESRYITTLIVTGFGHLQKLGVTTAGNPEVAGIVQKALPYLDAELAKDLKRLKRYAKGDDLNKDHLGWAQIQYLYIRSFYKDVEIAGATQEAFDYYFNQSKTYWNTKDSYAQGMISLALHRYEEQKVPATILEGMRQTAVQNEELGMYWKSDAGWFWHQAPIERQALFIEAFDEIEKDQQSVEAMKLWLLKNKQTNDWKTTRATVAACNALLMTGSNWLENNEVPEFSMSNAANNQELQQKIASADKEAGSGYFRVNWSGAEVKPDMGSISVTRKESSGAAWGAMYWQYFEDLDKITYAATPLSMKREIYREENSPTGPKLVLVGELDPPLEPGDKLMVRIELRVDRDMEYLHMKDMRAAGLEPINVLSGYRYQDGLSYYQSTRDAATHFFFTRLRGNQTYVFEYPLRVSHPGNFSNGISTIQCMYAPEFTSHSEGMRVEVE
jgi:uncharacterized protein YfaS (alpha-2-macroglobulin family)